MPADRFAQGGLGAKSNRVDEILDFENRFFGAPNHPENDGVDIDGNGVAGESRFGAYTCDADSLIDDLAERIHYRNHQEHSRLTHTDESSEAQHRDFFPLLHDADREQEVEAKERSDDGGF